MPDAFLLQLVAIVTSLSSTPPLSWANLLFYDWWLRWFLMTFGRLGWHAGWYDYTGCIIMMIVIFCFWGAPMMMLLYRSESSSGFYSSFRWPAGTVMMMVVVASMMMMMILLMAGSAANLPFINSAPRYRVCMTGGWPVWYHHDCHHLHSYKWGKTTPDHTDIQTERNDTNFLESGPYMALPLPHPTRIVNILFGSLYMVVVPFVYYCIFRYCDDDDGGFYDGKWWQWWWRSWFEGETSPRPACERSLEQNDAPATEKTQLGEIFKDRWWWWVAIGDVFYLIFLCKYRWWWWVAPAPELL